MNTYLNLESVVYIPIYLIWKIQTRWTQKLAPVCSPCLTVVIIAITITRASGIRWRGGLDSIWEVFFSDDCCGNRNDLDSGACVPCTICFRAKERRKRSWWASMNRVFYILLSPRTWRSKSKSSGMENVADKDVENGDGFPSIPGGTMTGMRSFIDRQGKSTIQGSRVVHSIALTEGDDDSWPLSEDIRPTQQRRSR